MTLLRVGLIGCGRISRFMPPSHRTLKAASGSMFDEDEGPNGLTSFQSQNGLYSKRLCPSRRLTGNVDFPSLVVTTQRHTRKCGGKNGCSGSGDALPDRRHRAPDGVVLVMR